MQPGAGFEIMYLADAATTYLPVDSIFGILATKEDGPFKGEKIAVYHGDLSLDYLVPDDIPVMAGEDDVHHLLIDGDLTLEQYILCKDGNSRMNLIVTGNLRVSNLVVCGQMLYVGGQLQASELVWVHHHSGSLYVKGDASGNVLLLTGESWFVVRGVTRFKTLIDDEISKRGLDVDYNYRLGQAIIPAVLTASEIGDDFPDEERINVYLQQGKSVLRQHPEPPFPFGEGEINAGNIRRLAASLLMPFNSHKYEFWEGENFFRVSRPQLGKSTVYSVYIQQERQYAVLLELREASGSGQVQTWCRYVTGEDTAWARLGDDAPQHFQWLLSLGWPTLLSAVARFEPLWQELQQTISVAKVEALLALPVAKLFPYFGSPGRFSYGGFTYRLRQAYDVKDGKTFAPQLSVYWQHPQKDSAGFAGFGFQVATDTEGNKAVVPIYWENDKKPGVYVQFDDMALAGKALWMFKRMERVLYVKNERLCTPVSLLIPDTIPAGYKVDEALFLEWFHSPLFRIEKVAGAGYDIWQGRVTIPVKQAGANGFVKLELYPMGRPNTFAYTLQKKLGHISFQMFYTTDTRRFTYMMQRDTNDTNSWYEVKDPQSREMEAIGYMFHEASQWVERITAENCQ